MSAPPKFATLADAIAAYLAGRSRRWAEVDGWQIDLEQAAAVVEPVDAAADERALRFAREYVTVGGMNYLTADPAAWDAAVAKNIAAELSQAVEVLPELAVPSEAARDASVYRCPWCSKPWDGAP